MQCIQGKRALITGAAGGIGRAVALKLARRGADLFLLDIDQHRLTDVAWEARSLGAHVHCWRCDLSKPDEIDAATESVLSTWGGLDLLINNAGVCYYGPTVHMSAEQWDWLMSVNLLAPIQLIRQFLPTLLERSEAHIVNVASMYGLFTTPRSAAYHASKFGLVGLSEALRMEFGQRGLGVSVICPGFVHTGFFEATPCGHANRTTPRPPRWICTTPEKVAASILQAIRHNRRMVLVTPLARALYLQRRLAPGLLDWISGIGRRRKLRARRRQLQTASLPPSESLVTEPHPCNRAA